MGFGKAFGIGLVVFIGINFGLALIAFAIGTGNIMGFFDLLTDMGALSSILFTPVMFPPGDVWLGLMSILMGDIGWISVSAIYAELVYSGGSMIALIGFIVAPLLAALIAGKMAEGKGAAFGASLMIFIISAVIIMVLGMISGAMTLELGSILSLIIIAALVGIFYGCFALLTAGSEFY